MSENQDFRFTYRITTKIDPERHWSMRLDHYIKVGDDNIHTFAIITTSVIIVILLIISGLVIASSITKDFETLFVLDERRILNRESRITG